MKFKKSLVASFIALLMVLAQCTFLNLQEVNGYEENLTLDIFTQKKPFNGLGPNQPSDPFAPYEVVQIYGSVTYNEQPLSDVLITFNITGPPNGMYNYTFQTVRKTNATGMASFSFSIPLLNLSDGVVIGTWTVRAHAEFKGKHASDTLTFKVDWIIKVLSVKPVNSTGHYQNVFGIEGDIGVEITLRNIAKTFKNAALFVGFHDELNVHFGNKTKNFIIEPNDRIVRIYFKLSIPKYTAPYNATLYACAFTLEGTAYCPQVSSSFVINPSKPPSTINIHDLSIVNLELTKSRIGKGEKLGVYITVRNEGTETENFTIHLYCDSFLINELEVRNLEPYTQRTLNLEFNTSKLDSGKHIISASIVPLPYEAETEDNVMSKELTVYVPYHDLSIIDVRPSSYEAEIGDIIPINVTLRNNGTEKENFQVKVYANSSLIGIIDVYNLAPNKTISKVFNWNTSALAKGLYVLEAEIPPVPGEENIENNRFTDGIVRLKPPPISFHDVAVEAVSIDKYEATIGETVTITVRVKNRGNFTERFRVEVYVNQTIIGNQTLRNIASLEEKTLTFIWNTTDFEEGRYLVKAVIPPLLTEENTENNVYEDGTITLLPPTPAFWNLFLILLIIILLLLLFLTLFALKKKKKRKGKGRLLALIKVSVVQTCGDFEHGSSARS